MSSAGRGCQRLAPEHWAGQSRWPQASTLQVPLSLQLKDAGHAGPHSVHARQAASVVTLAESTEKSRGTEPEPNRTLAM